MQLPSIPAAHAASLVAWGADGTAFASNPGVEQALPQGYQNTFWYNPLSRYSGFTFVGWRDARDSMLHVQKLDADGVGQWGSAGVAIDGTTFSVYNIITRPDGAGGVYVIWEQGSNINVIRLDSGGGVHSGWATTGTQASNNNYFDTQGAVLDGAGGVIVIYDVSGNDIKGTHILPDGTTDWFDQLILDAVDYCTIDVAHAVSDGTGGVFIGWYGYLCSDFIAHYHLLRLDDDGTVSSGWNALGEDIDSWSPFDDSSRGLDLVADGSGGVIVAWKAFRTGFSVNGRDVKAQHFDAAGNELWTMGGVNVAASDTADEDVPFVVTDGTGEAVVSFRVDEDHINAQRLNSSGATQWTAGGVTILDNTQYMENVPVTDGAGGLIVAWQPSGSPGDLYVQRWSSSASKLWGASGTQASSIIATSQPFTRLLSNGANGVALVFESSDSPTQIIAQQVCEDTCPSSGSSTNDPTLSNKLTMSRLKAGTASAVALSFQLQNTLTGTLTVTFPGSFTVTGAFTSGSCSGGGTIGTFNYTSTTLTAVKTGCAGTVSLSGATVTTPNTPGLYTINWTNDDPGSTQVAIMDDDQVTVAAQVDASITFDIDVQSSCGSESAAPYTVPLGNLSSASVTTAASHICLDLDANAAGGAVVTLKGSGASDALESAASGDVIATAYSGTPTLLAAGTEGYGICVASTSVALGSATASAPYNADCSADYVGGVDASAAETVLTTGGAAVDGTANDTADIVVRASVASTTAAANDYTDTLTFIATGTF